MNTEISNQFPTERLQAIYDRLTEIGDPASMAIPEVKALEDAIGEATVAVSLVTLLAVADTMAGITDMLNTMGVVAHVKGDADLSEALNALALHANNVDRVLTEATLGESSIDGDLPDMLVAAEKAIGLEA